MDLLKLNKMIQFIMSFLTKRKKRRHLKTRSRRRKNLNLFKVIKIQEQ